MSNCDLQIIATEISCDAAILAAELEDMGIMSGVAFESSLHEVVINPIDSDADEG